jgi:Heavy-metal resistance
MFVTSSIQSARRSDGRIRRVVASTVAAVSLVVLAPSASAQFGGFGGQNTGLNSRDMSQYGDILALDDEQRDVVQILFEEFMQETQEITSKMRAQMESAREEMRSGGGDFTQFRTMAEEAGKKRADLQERFLGDVRVILSEEQAQRWPRLERAIRRNQSLRRGFLSGERVDLTKVLPQIDLVETSLDQVNASLAQYEVDLDRAIVARDEAQTRAMGQVREIFQSGDDGALDDLFDKQRKLSVRVRDVNRRYAREIEGMLGSDEKAAFSEAFRRASFPQVFRTGRGQRVVELVLAYEDLNDEQRTRIEGIAESFGRDRSKLNERHIAAIEDSEMSMSVRDMFRQRGRQGGNRRGGEREATPQDEVAQKKRDLDAKTIESIQRVLGEGQASRLEDQLNKIREQEREQRRGNNDGGRFRRDR